MSRNEYYIMVKAERQHGKRFKDWCRVQGLSMNKAFNLFMRSAVNNDFVLKQGFRSNGGKNEHH